MGFSFQSRRTVLILGVVTILAAFAASDEMPTSCLWKVENGQTTVYLLGSIHALTDNVYPLSPAIEQAFSNARTVIFEVDIKEMQEAAMTMLARGTLENGKALADVVSEGTYRLAVERLEGTGLGVAGFDRMHPWMLAVTLMSYELTRAGFKTANGIDMHVYNRAIEAGKSTGSLETAASQIDLFTSMTEEESETFLRYTLEDLDTVIPQLEEIARYWRAGETAKLEILLTEAFDEFPVLFDRIVNDRNTNWLAPIENLLNGDHHAMVVVGALHLVGEKGLPELLRRRGYTVEQL